jgi:hypothetical protein
MRPHDAERLLALRSQWEMWSAVLDTSQWDVTFFFKLLEQKDKELAELRRDLSTRP